MSFNPAKVSLMAFAVLFKILSAYCASRSSSTSKEGSTKMKIRSKELVPMSITDLEANDYYESLKSAGYWT